MLSIIGTYQDGLIKLDKDYNAKKPMKVIVTFLEDLQINSDEDLNLTDFSFAKSKKNLKSFKGSFANSVMEERRSEL